MTHKDRKKAKRYDIAGRCKEFTDIVYSGVNENPRSLYSRLSETEKAFFPKENEYNLYFGDIHGHTNLSDGNIDIDTYFTGLRDVAKLDFGALADHDHGGVGKCELWGEKWEIIKSKVKEYNKPLEFTTILAYERDSYPWYNNLVVYYDNYDGEMIRDVRDGEITEEKLKEYLAREDILLVPHDTQILSAGCDFCAIPLENMTPLIQVCSRGYHAEKYDENCAANSSCEGGYWQDALKKGAKMGCIGCTDDHFGFCGIIKEDTPAPQKFPALTGVWAKENTLPSIFEALRQRRCFAFTGGRISIDFRINGHYMGEEIADNGDRNIYFKVEADGKIERITLVKNCRDYIELKGAQEQLIFDYQAENDTDYYYIRVKLVDGRMAWSSPIWVNKDK